MHLSNLIFILSLLSFLSLGIELSGQDIESLRTSDSDPGDTITLEVTSVQATPGDTICVPITVQNFDSVVGMQFSLHWNSIHFKYLDYENFNLPAGNINLVTNATIQGYFAISWFKTEMDGYDIPNDSTLMELCFIAQGSPNDHSDISFVDEPTPLEITTWPLRNKPPVKTLDGTMMTIPPDTLYGAYTSCPSPVGTEGGSFNLSVYSGTPPYHIQWEHSHNPNLTGSDTIAQAGGRLHYTGLPPTTDSTYYDLTITDQDDSTTTLKVDIEPSPTAYLALGVQNNCPGPGNATLGIDSVQALEPYTLEWNTAEYNVHQIKDLDAGAYALTLTDRNGCEVTDSFDLQFRNLRLDYSTLKDNTCEGISNGSATVRAKSGHPDEQGRYTYRWSNQEVHLDTVSTISGLSEDNYFVTISDERNCKRTEYFDVDNKQSIDVDELFVDPVSCPGGTDGNIAFSVYMDGGPEPHDSTYVFDWSSDIPSTSSGDSIWTGHTLAAGTYHVTVYDDSTRAGCRDDFSLTVEEPDSLYHTVHTTPVTDSTPIGSIELDIFGGTPPYSIDWFSQGDQINPQLDSLEAGNYIFKLTDDNGCMLVDTIEVEDLATASQDPKSASQWKIYPNPADRWIYLECGDPCQRIIQWQLSNLEGVVQGEAIYTDNYPARLRIAVSSLQSGVYFLRWTTEDGRVWSRKAVIY